MKMKYVFHSTLFVTLISLWMQSYSMQERKCKFIAFSDSITLKSGQTVKVRPSSSKMFQETKTGIVIDPMIDNGKSTLFWVKDKIGINYYLKAWYRNNGDETYRIYRESGFSGELPVDIVQNLNEVYQEFKIVRQELLKEVSNL